MIHSLTIKGHPTVPNTTVAFNEGFNLITAANGKGKTTILELIEYSIFGATALRTALGQYPTLATEITFTLKGKQYSVSRSPRNTTLSAKGEVIAVGVTPVNAAILRLLCYGKKVYEVANYIKQGYVKALTQVLRADDRRQVLETTIGLNIIDNVIKELSDSMRGYETELRVHEGLAVEPIKPTPPTNYLFSRTDALKIAENRRNTYIELTAKMTSALQPVAPTTANVTPEEIEVLSCAISDLKVQQAKHIPLVEAVVRLNKLATLPTLGDFQFVKTLKHEELVAHLRDAEVQDERYRQWFILKTKADRFARPELTEAQIIAGGEAIKLAALWKQYRKLLEIGDTQCPECGAEFHLAHKELKDFPFTPDSHKPATGQTENYLWQQSRVWAEDVPKAAEVTAELDALNFDPNGYKPNQVVFFTKALNAKVTYDDWAAHDYPTQLAEAEAALAASDNANASATLVVLTKQLIEAQRSHSDCLIYTERLARFFEQRAINEALLVERKPFENATEELTAMRDLDRSCNEYEHALRFYETRSADYQGCLANITLLSDTLSDYKAAIEGLKEAKKEMKNYLLPSLNTAATTLAMLMSEGVIKSVNMNADFSVTALDNKTPTLRAVDSFSGSEQSIINLALRIALGQVLTHQVFSVLIGDEIDAELDAKRTAEVWRALSRLVETGKVKQVILVSHEQEPIEVPQLFRVEF